MPDAGVAVDSTMVLTVGISTAAVLFAAIVVLIVLGRSESNAARIEWLKHPWLVAIGKYSYGMYVLHTLIMTIIIHRTIRYFPLIENLPGYIGKPCLGVFVIALSFGAAYLSYHCFEKQFLSMKKYFNDDRRPYVATRAMG
jgi:peptidoglycan/LPS O-acetylase OafA/YrhL